MHMTPQVYVMNAALSRVLSITQIILPSINGEISCFYIITYEVYLIKRLDATPRHNNIRITPT